MTSYQPRYAEFVRLRTITEKWVEWENVDGNENDPQITDGGGPNG